MASATPATRTFTPEEEMLLVLTSESVNGQVVTWG